ncbi:peptidoglycan-binding protein [Streptomyces sp. NPDC055966]|uniref:peptidoglycan-binding domain-containing protein n=1 Tax=Streptomyces sp. NPDC055966 TaxID=3345669 RepID=UPI0035D55360
MAKHFSVAIAVPMLFAATTGIANASTTAPYVGYGYSTKYNAVLCVQHNLNYAFQNTPLANQNPPAQLAEDGIWGNKTWGAVEWFQSKTNIQVDGIVGPNTGDWLAGYGDPSSLGSPYRPCYPYIPTSW